MGSMFIHGKKFERSSDKLCIKPKRGILIIKKMRSWSDVEKYHEEVKEYLIKDVECLYQIAVAFISKFCKKLNSNVFKFLTISQACF